MFRKLVELCLVSNCIFCIFGGNSRVVMEKPNELSVSFSDIFVESLIKQLKNTLLYFIFCTLLLKIGIFQLVVDIVGLGKFSV